MKKIKKILARMYLSHHSDEAKRESKGFYEYFYKKLVKKTNDKNVSPAKMDLIIIHPIGDFQTKVIVKYGSLVHLVKGEDQNVIGFYVTVYIPFSKNPYRLTAKKTGEVFLEKEKDIFKMIKKVEKKDKKRLQNSNK